MTYRPPRAIRRRIISFRLGTLITLLTRKPIAAAKIAPDAPRGRQLTLAGRVSAAHQRRRTTTSDREQQPARCISAEHATSAQRAAILLPSFRSPRLCNYDFIFMDINYTGRLAVSLYGILIQGCRHNGNPRHTDSLLTCPWVRDGTGREGYPALGHRGGKADAKPIVGYVDFAPRG